MIRGFAKCEFIHNNYIFLHPSWLFLCCFCFCFCLFFCCIVSVVVAGLFQVYLLAESDSFDVTLSSAGATRSNRMIRKTLDTYAENKIELAVMLP